MHARVWKLRIRPGKIDDFYEALSSVVTLARRERGYRGVLALGTGKQDAPDVTLVAVWDSLEEIRASERNLFLMQAISRYLECCEGMPHHFEEQLLATDFIATEIGASA